MSGLQFIVPRQEHAASILSWRRKTRVTKFMFTDVADDLAAQQDWLLRATLRDDYRHWLILHGDRPIGLVNLQQIDWLARRSASGFYIGEDDALPLGGFVLPYLYNHGFDDLGFEAMTAEVMAGNDDVLRLHRLHGYQEDGIAGGTVIKHGVAYDVHHLTLTREAWLSRTSYRRYRAEFPWPSGAHSLSAPLGGRGLG